LPNSRRTAPLRRVWSRSVVPFFVRTILLSGLPSRGIRRIRRLPRGREPRRHLARLRHRVAYPLPALHRPRRRRDARPRPLASPLDPPEGHRHGSHRRQRSRRPHTRCPHRTHGREGLEPQPPRAHRHCRRRHRRAEWPREGQGQRNRHPLRRRLREGGEGPLLDLRRSHGIRSRRLAAASLPLHHSPRCHRHRPAPYRPRSGHGLVRFLRHREEGEPRCHARLRRPSRAAGDCQPVPFRDPAHGRRHARMPRQTHRQDLVPETLPPRRRHHPCEGRRPNHL